MCNNNIIIHQDDNDKTHIDNVLSSNQNTTTIRIDNTIDTVGCASCLICGELIQIHRGESYTKVCTKCKDAVIRLRKMYDNDTVASSQIDIHKSAHENNTWCTYSDPEYKCPKCGGGMRKNQSLVYPSLPPKYEYKCDTCGFVEYKL